MVNADGCVDSMEMDECAKQKNQPNGNLDSSSCPKIPEIKSRVYKLMIQIEKIRQKPCPKSKKLYYQSTKKKQEEEAASEKIINTDRKTLSPRKESLCLICNENFQSAQSLYLHKKKHHRFVCQICDAYCSTRVICDRHEKLHLSNDPNLPHKCHLCPQKFDSKRNVRLHTRVMHSFVPPTITKSAVPLIQENVLRLKTSHENVDYKEKTILRKNEAKNSNNCGPVTFTCRVCCQDFATVEAAESHTREHLELAEKDLTCNICKKIFKNEIILNAHLAQHLSRALRCPMCPKAFINRPTLRIHMKSHEQDKR